MNRLELFFGIYYMIALQFFLIPMASTQLLNAANLLPLFNSWEVDLSIKIGIILFIIPIVFGFGLLVYSYLVGRKVGSA